MELGAFVILDMNNLEEKFKDLVEIGLYTCQLQCPDVEEYTQENADRIMELAKKYNVKITALWCGAALVGPCVWDPFEGPNTIGLVPLAYRQVRMNNLLKCSDFAKMMGITDIITHLGFIPENPSSTEFQSLASAVKYVANYFKRNGQYFLFETGQETPITLRRMIEKVGTGNLGINLDPANLITYGKGNPVDALTVFGEFVRGVHAKDGNYPTSGDSDGKETPLGEGTVDFPRLIEKLKSVGYDGALTIEREITGEKQRRDIILAKGILEKLI